MPSSLAMVIPPELSASSTTRPPWKSGRPPQADAVQAVVPSVAMAATVPSFWKAKMSARPLALGTAGTIL